MLLLTALLAKAGDYTGREDVEAFIATMVEQHGFLASDVRDVLNQAAYRQDIIDLITRPAEAKPWVAYQKIFVTPTRIQDGVAFTHANWETLQRAETDFGVPKEIIVAIIGVETNYGRNKGKHRVLDALATLGFDYPKRAEFFIGQLEEFLVLACEERVRPFDRDDSCQRPNAGATLGSTVEIGELVGSYAGAMGYGQFIPSSYRHYAIDYDGDGNRDIWNNVVDAIGSVAAYFKDHGWQHGEPIIAQVGLAQDAANLDDLANDSYSPTHTIAEWKAKGVQTADTRDSAYAALFRYENEDAIRHYLGYHNFYVITRYNISRLYAKAVVEVSEAIASAL
ncbi:MAG: lytic murein transglycosylase B [Gammaproteobacteria bacterium]|nr:lytic murein transglycosylase B [Gammaproteobacteria bacterium]